MKKEFKKGQSVLEYIIILTAIILVIVAAASGPITGAVNNLMGRAAGSINTAAGGLP